MYEKFSTEDTRKAYTGTIIVEETLYPWILLNPILGEDSGVEQAAQPLS